MKNYAVTDAGLDFLKRSGLADAIETNWNRINNEIPMHVVYEDEFNEECNNMINSYKTPSSRKRKIKEMMKSSKNSYDNDIGHNLFIVSGVATDIVLSDNDKQNFREYGVDTLSQLDEVIGYYCIEKHLEELSSREKYIWRNHGYKTEIYGDMHGDLKIVQTNTEPKIDKNTIDKKEIVQLSGKLPRDFVDADYSYWTTLVATSLKYADTVDAEIPDMINWSGMMRHKFPGKWNGEIANPSLGSGIGYLNFVNDFIENDIPRIKGKSKTIKPKKWMFGHMRPNSNHEVNYFPLIDQEENLVICSNLGADKEMIANVELAYHDEEFYPRIIIPKEDISELFRGAVHGIMTGQSRTLPEYLAYMFWEYDRLKEGLTWEEIYEKAHETFKRGF